MAAISYEIAVHNDYEHQEISIPTQFNGVVSEAAMDAAAKAFGEALLSAPSDYPLTLDHVRKTKIESTTTTTDL